MRMRRAENLSNPVEGFEYMHESCKRTLVRKESNCVYAMVNNATRPDEALDRVVPPTTQSLTPLP